MILKNFFICLVSGVVIIGILTFCHSRDINITMKGDGGDTKRFVQFAKGDKILHAFEVELAISNEERARGLMYRREMADDYGMLFIFQNDADHTFWMKNTYIPLDMIFIDRDLNVVGVYRDAKPLSEESISVRKSSRYVLEIKAGLSERFGIDEGVKAVFINIFP